MDYGKNLQLPYISPNDVYYKRQLSTYAFNIHVLSSAESVFYLYPETEEKKGSDDVYSLVHHFMDNFLHPTVKHLDIFYDSCSGQEKNFTLFRFLYNFINMEEKLESIKVTFPARGHSSMECDKNMGLINSKAKAELAKDWFRIFEEARQNPSPFKEVEVNHDFFRKWTVFLDDMTERTLPISAEKFSDLQHLARFCTREAADIYTAIKYNK
ncbi:hypothetical protein ANN_26357 [Periplaneta americana]|uniref:Uncharacterized protein n=1 Tax=Periplaneta americana TaxID=6978 RepID=A0ABQ8S616_PERAM|nr:hypothetical protein ANN_26357 [Periplaneta americana]